jgi:hypothetical protein
MTANWASGAAYATRADDELAAMGCTASRRNHGSKRTLPPPCALSAAHATAMSTTHASLAVGMRAAPRDGGEACENVTVLTVVKD